MIIQTLDSLQIGEKAIIEQMETEGSIRRRFLDIGLIPGCLVECILKSPYGNPIAYSIRGATIAIRNEDAKTIWVKKVEV